MLIPAFVFMASSLRRKHFIHRKNGIIPFQNQNVKLKIRQLLQLGAAYLNAQATLHIIFLIPQMKYNKVA